MRALGDGGSATTACLGDLPDTVAVVWRCRLSGQREALPEPPAGHRRGRPPRQGKLGGAPTTLARQCRGGQPHPTDANAAIPSWVGLWHTVLPGRRVPGVVGRRLAAARPHQPGQHPPRPAGEAVCTTALSRSGADRLRHDRDRWAVALTMRDRQPCDGLGQDQCRTIHRMVGAHTVRRVLAAARTLWVLDHATQPHALDLRRDRPWYRQTSAPTHLDIACAGRDTWQEAGVCPIPRFVVDRPDNHQEPESA